MKILGIGLIIGCVITAIVGLISLDFAEIMCGAIGICLGIAMITIDNLQVELTRFKNGNYRVNNQIDAMFNDVRTEINKIKEEIKQKED